MPNVYKPNLIQVRPQYGKEGIGSTPENVLWFTGAFSGGLDISQLEAIQTVVNTYWFAMWKRQAADSAMYKGSIITDWSSNTGLSVDTSGFTPEIGINGSDLPNKASMLISIKVSERYRGGKGRVYLPFPGSGSLNDGDTWDAATVTAVSGDFNTFLTQMTDITSTNGGPFVPMLYRFRNETSLAQLVPWASFEIGPTPATQRRRLRKVAHH